MILFLSCTALSCIFFSLSYISFSQVINNDPDILTKIETALAKRYDLNRFQVSLPKYISLQYSKIQDSWKFDLNTKKIKITAMTSNIEVLENKEDTLLVKAKGYVDQKRAEKLLDISFSKSELKIKEWDNHISKDIEIQIYIPEAFKKTLEITTASGKIEIEKNFLDKIKLSSISGDVSIEQNSVSAIEIETVSGNLTIEFANQHIPFQFKINTLSGDITNTIKETAKSGKLIWIKTVSGNVEID